MKVKGLAAKTNLSTTSLAGIVFSGTSLCHVSVQGHDSIVKV